MKAMVIFIKKNKNKNLKNPKNKNKNKKAKKQNVILTNMHTTVRLQNGKLKQLLA